MLNLQRAAGDTDVSVVVRIIDSSDGTPETGVVWNTSGIDLRYRRDGAAGTAITEATQTVNGAHTDGGFAHIGFGNYRLDLPDAAVATGVKGVLVYGTVTGMIVLPTYVQLTSYNPYDSVRMGMTALPNAAADAAGGLPISDAGGFDVDAILARLPAALVSGRMDSSVGAMAANVLTASAINTNAITAAKIAADAIGASELAADAATEIATAVWAAVTRTLTAGTNLNDLSAAQVNAEVDTALADIGLDHLISSALPTNWATDVASGSVFDNIADDGTAAYDRTTDSLQAIADSGGGGPTAAQIADAVWDEAQADHVAAGSFGLVASEIADILADTNELQTDDVPGLIAALNDLDAAAVNAEVDTALADIGLDHLINSALPTSWAADVAANSVFDQIADDGTAAYDRTTDSLQAIADSGGGGPTAAQIADAVWDELQSGHVTAGSFGEIATEIASILADTDELQSDDVPGLIAALNDPTAAAIADAVWDELQSAHVTAGSFGEIASEIASILVDTGTTLDGKLNTIDGIVDNILLDTAEIGTAGAGLTDLGGMSTGMKGEVNAEVDTALADYDAPTRAELTTDINSILTQLRGLVMEQGTIGATGNSTTALHLDGLTYADDEINDQLLVVRDVSNDEYHTRWIDDWADTGDLATVATLPFTPQASTDTYWLLSIRRDSSLTAVEIRAAVGLATANLDTQLSTIDTVVDGIQTDLDNGTDGLGAIKTDTAAILVDTNELQTDDVPGLIAALNDLDAAAVNAEVDTALADIGLDHLVSASVAGTDVADDSIVAKLVSKSATADWDDFVNTTDSLQAIKDVLGSPAGADVSADIASVQTDTTAIVADTNELQTDWADGGRLDLLIDAILADTGELQADDVPGLIAGLNDLSAAEANAEMVDVLATDTYAEPGQGAPAATATIAAKINYLFKWTRNKKDYDGTTAQFYADDASTVDQKRPISDSGGTTTEGEMVTGP